MCAGNGIQLRPCSGEGGGISSVHCSTSAFRNPTPAYLPVPPPGKGGLDIRSTIRYLSSMPKKISLVRNARVMPFQGTMDSFAAGVFGADGRFFENSLIPLRGKPSEPLPVTRKLTGTSIYGGYLFFHFGHFLIESLSRMYAIRQCGNYPIVFTSPNAIVNANAGAAQKAMFRFLRLENEIVLLTEPTEIENLVMADAGSAVAPPLFTEEQARALGVFQAGAHGMEDRKIWLSRSKFKGGGLENEAAIEAELHAMGWTIVHPEELPYREQARLVSTSRAVAGLDGSAFFSALLADKVLGEMFVFSRRNHIPPILSLALSRKTGRVREFLFPLEHLGGQYAEARYLLRDPERILGPLRGV